MYSNPGIQVRSLNKDLVLFRTQSLVLSVVQAEMGGACQFESTFITFVKFGTKIKYHIITY